MTKYTRDLPLATSDQLADARIVLIDANGQEVQGNLAEIAGGGTSLIVNTDNTNTITGRLISPGNVVQDLKPTITIDGAVISAAKITATNTQGTFVYNATVADGPHTGQVKFASFLVKDFTWTKLPISVNTVLPAATGTGIVGSTITVTSGTWTNSPVSYAYRWLRSGVIIPGATGTSYVVQDVDQFDVIQPQVAVTNLGGTTAWTNATMNYGAIARPDTAVTVQAVATMSPTTPGSKVKLSTGTYTNGGVESAYFWEADGVRLTAAKAPVIQYLSYGSNNPGVPSSMVNAPSASNYNLSFSTGAYGGTNTDNASVSAFATENDYFYTAAGYPGAAGGNDGAQTYSLTLRHVSTSTQLKFQLYIARVDSTGTVYGTEQVMSRTGAPVGQETAAHFVTASTAYTYTYTGDMGAWQAGDRLRFHMIITNTGSASNNYQLDPRSGNSYVSMPFGPYQSDSIALNELTTKAAYAGKAIRANVTYTNGNYTHSYYTNTVTVGAATTQTQVPVVTVAPKIIGTPYRVGVTFSIDVGEASNQPTGNNVKWQELISGVWTDIAGATTAQYKTVVAQQDRDIRVGVQPYNNVGTGAYAFSDPITILPAARYISKSLGSDTFDGLTPETPWQNLSMISAANIPSGGVALLKCGDEWPERFPPMRSNLTISNYGSGPLPKVSTDPLATFSIDAYTDSGGYIGIGPVTVDGIEIHAANRGIMVRNTPDWKIKNTFLTQVGMNPTDGNLENAQGMYFLGSDRVVIDNVVTDFVGSDCLYFDNCDHITITNTTCYPPQSSEGDNLQTRATSKSDTRQNGLYIKKVFFDMGSRKTGSGKGCMVANMQDNSVVMDSEFFGNNYCKATDEGDDHCSMRNVYYHARKNNYSSCESIGGIDSQPTSHRHHWFDHIYRDAIRAVSFSGQSATGFTGVLQSGRADMYQHDCMVDTCNVGVRIDRPTTGMCRGFVFHNVGVILDRTTTAVPPTSVAPNFQVVDYWSYKGTKKLPAVITRAAITGTRRSGQTLTGPDSTFDMTEIAAGPITRTYQWRRHRPMPNNGLTCEWIAGATSASYTQTDDDIGCVISRVDRIHSGNPGDVVTALAYDASYATAPRTGDSAGVIPPIGIELVRLGITSALHPTTVFAGECTAADTFTANVLVGQVTGFQPGSTIDFLSGNTTATPNASFTVDATGKIYTTGVPLPANTYTFRLRETNAAAINSPKYSVNKKITVLP
jgi:hypothetical protein